MANRTVFVDGTTSGTPGTNGAHYASLQAAITGESGAAPNLPGDSAILSIECSVFSGNAADTTACTVNGFTTDATHYVYIYAPVRHSGTWDATKYRLEVTNASALVIRNEYVRIDGLQVRVTGVAQNDCFPIQIFGVSTSVLYVSNTITRCSPGDTFRQTGIWVADPDVTAYIWNWLDYGHPAVQSFYNSSLMVEGGSTVHVYSSTLIGGYEGIYSTDVGTTVTAKNCYASTNDDAGGGAGYIDANGSTITQTTCAASDDTSAVSGLDNIAVNTTNFTNVTSGSENFHLPIGSALIDVGTNTTGDAAPMNFTTDIDGVTRSGTWDIGADELAAGGRASKNTRAQPLGIDVGMNWRGQA